MGEASMSQPIIGALACSTTVEQRLYFATDAFYIRTIVAHGGIPFLIPPGQDATALDGILDRIDGLLVPGGTDIAPERYGEERHPKIWRSDPELDAFELPLVARAYERDIPTLCICRGIQ